MTQVENGGAIERAPGRPSANRRAKPARAHKTAMIIAQEIVHKISLNDYRPGTKLPTEREMLEEYGVGRGTLRESLRFLEMNGVITMKPGPGGGPVTGQSDARDLAGTLALFLEMHRTSFNSIVEVRRYIEPIIAKLAAMNANAEALHEIQESVDMMRSNLENEAQFIQANEGFHNAVAWATANPVFALLIGSLHWITDGTPLGVDYPKERREAVLKAHERIYEAIASGDAETAESEMAIHIEEFSRYLDRYYLPIYDSALSWRNVVT
jgi:GntR family transcriptional repressor for pyruvate dehydrogenase complex